MKQVLELYGSSTLSEDTNWECIVDSQHCPFIGSRCSKIRKSQPDVTIGTCSVSHGRDSLGVMICPNRLLERKQIFLEARSAKLASKSPRETYWVLPGKKQLGEDYRSQGP